MSTGRIKNEKKGGLVPGTGNSNRTKWASESARVASQHRNTNYAGVPNSNSKEKPNNVYRIDMDTKEYNRLRNDFVRGSTRETEKN